jgi:hypothetical protein
LYMMFINRMGLIKLNFFFKHRRKVLHGHFFL